MHRLAKIILNPASLAILIGTFILLVIPPIFEKFSIHQLRTMHVSRKQSYFHDFNYDSKTEWAKLSYNYNNPKFPSLSYVGKPNQYSNGDIEQINWERPWLSSTMAFFGDYNGDSLDEIYVFTTGGDSLFLLCLEPYLSGSILYERFIDILPYREGAEDFKISSQQLIDLDGDGNKEVIFAIMAGFGLNPRLLYAYDRRKDTLIRSKSNYAMAYEFEAVHIKNKTAFIYNKYSYSTHNYKLSESGHFTDTVSWLIVLKPNFEFLFPPIPNIGDYTNIHTACLQVGDKIAFVANKRYRDINLPDSLLKIDLNGNIVKRKPIPFADDKSCFLISVISGGISRVFIYSLKERRLYELNLELEVVKKINNISMTRVEKIADLNDDNSMELFCHNTDNHQVTIFQEEFTNPVYLNFPPSPEKPIISKCSFEDGYANLSIQYDDYIYFYKFEANPIFYLRVPIYISIYLLLFLFFTLLQKYQQKVVRRKYELQQKINQLELLTIKNQIEPHFTFNVINSISSLIYLEDRRKAHQILLNFSNLIRSTLMNSQKLSISLIEEIENVEKYLILEQLRFENTFSFKIYIKNDVDTYRKIPKMIIQVFTENAVKHGLIHKKDPGHLGITIKRNEDVLSINITDNGIGRERSAELKMKSTGKGIDIVRQIIVLYNRLNNTHVSFDINDLYTQNGLPCGTEVEIRIPETQKT
jgi:hypothetical protein